MTEKGATECSVAVVKIAWAAKRLIFVRKTSFLSEEVS
jgi:hypothetical protein